MIISNLETWTAGHHMSYSLFQICLKSITISNTDNVMLTKLKLLCDDRQNR